MRKVTTKTKDILPIIEELIRAHYPEIEYLVFKDMRISGGLRFPGKNARILIEAESGEEGQSVECSLVDLIRKDIRFLEAEEKKKRLSETAEELRRIADALMKMWN